eukprot:scaffold241_cov242-Pinguiococcus_pyrenoidosus.AAC.21
MLRRLPGVRHGKPPVDLVPNGSQQTAQDAEGLPGRIGEALLGHPRVRNGDLEELIRLPHHLATRKRQPDLDACLASQGRPQKGHLAKASKPGDAFLGFCRSCFVELVSHDRQFCSSHFFVTGCLHQPSTKRRESRGEHFAQRRTPWIRGDRDQSCEQRSCGAFVHGFALVSDIPKPLQLRVQAGIRAQAVHELLRRGVGRRFAAGEELRRERHRPIRDASAVAAAVKHLPLLLPPHRAGAQRRGEAPLHARRPTCGGAPPRQRAAKTRIERIPVAGRSAWMRFGDGARGSRALGSRVGEVRAVKGGGAFSTWARGACLEPRRMGALGVYAWRGCGWQAQKNEMGDGRRYACRYLTVLVQVTKEATDTVLVLRLGVDDHLGLVQGLADAEPGLSNLNTNALKVRLLTFPFQRAIIDRLGDALLDLSGSSNATGIVAAGQPELLRLGWLVQALDERPQDDVVRLRRRGSHGGQLQDQPERQEGAVVHPRVVNESCVAGCLNGQRRFDAFCVQGDGLVDDVSVALLEAQVPPALLLDELLHAIGCHGVGHDRAAGMTLEHHVRRGGHEAVAIQGLEGPAADEARAVDVGVQHDTNVRLRVLHGAQGLLHHELVLGVRDVNGESAVGG